MSVSPTDIHRGFVWEIQLFECPGLYWLEEFCLGLSGTVITISMLIVSSASWVDWFERNNLMQP